MSVFAASINAIFSNPHMSVAADYRAGGADPAIPVRVMRRAPDGIADFNGGRFVRDTIFIDVRTSEVADLSKGDTFTIDGTVYTVLDEPQRDIERLVWNSEARQ